MTNCCICDDGEYSIIMKINDDHFYLCSRECLLVFAVNELSETDQWCLADIEDLVTESYESDKKLFVKGDKK